MKTYTEFDLAGCVKKATKKHYCIYLEFDDNERILFCINKDDTDKFYCFNDLSGVFDYLEKQTDLEDEIMNESKKITVFDLNRKF